MSKPATLEPVTALSVVPDDGLSLFERLAKDPNASVEKIERLMALFERSEARKGESAFNTAMSAAQAEMRPVAADATNPQTRSRYASYAALDVALRPIYTKHGFGLSFDTGEGAPQDWIRVLCYVTHADGHARTYKADMPADGKGAKGGDVMTRTHAVGSAMSYGMRYLLRAIFNVAVGEDDDDGVRASARPAPTPAAAPVAKAPDGYATWVEGMTDVAVEGWEPFRKAWDAASESFRAHAVQHDLERFKRLKAKAREKR